MTEKTWKLHRSHKIDVIEISIYRALDEAVYFFKKNHTALIDSGSEICLCISPSFSEDYFDCRITRRPFDRETRPETLRLMRAAREFNDLISTLEKAGDCKTQEFLSTYGNTCLMYGDILESLIEKGKEL